MRGLIKSCPNNCGVFNCLRWVAQTVGEKVSSKTIRMDHMFAHNADLFRVIYCLMSAQCLTTGNL